MYWILLMYYLMFNVIELPPFLLNASPIEREMTVYLGALFVNALILGGFFSLVFFSSTSSTGRIVSTNLPERVIRQLFVLAWLPIISAAVAYFAYFHSQAYVALHIDGGGMLGYALKFVYISYAVVLFVGLLEKDFGRLKVKLIWLTIGFILVYGLLYKLRSPLMYYLLLLLFLFGRRMSFTTIVVSGFVIAVGLAGVALIRDTALTEGGVGTGLLDMIVGLGGQADTVIFAGQYVDTKGPLYGSGIIGSFLGLAEPMTNEYTRNISQDYFDEGGGFGFFIVSDFLLNFGLWLGPLAMFCFGWMLTNIRRDRSGFFAMAFAAVVYANAFALVRNDFGSTSRASAYTFLSVMLIVWIVSLSRRRSSHG